MEVIAAQNDYRGETAFAIVKVSQGELRRLVNASPHGKVFAQVGQRIHIEKRFDHAMKVEMEIASALTLPAKLRTLADMLEMNHPAIEQIVTEPTEFGV